MDTLSPSSQNQIPDADITAAFARADHYRDGHLYALHFTGRDHFTGLDGHIIKVGQSISIDNRLRSHLKKAKATGLEFVEQWVSEPHLNLTETEDILLAFCREQWRGVGDWFYGADHAEIVRFATDIPKETWNETRRKARAAYFLSATYPVEAAAAAVGLTFEEATR